MKLKQFRNEEGQTLVLTALLMCVLMGFMALAIDMGVSFRTQRRVQTQADAAAIAAALCGSYGGEFCTRFGGTDVSTVASGAATANGMPAGASISVTAPGYGQHTNSGYYEVIIKQGNSAPFVGTFAGLFYGGATANYNPLTVGARAVAGRVPGQTCLYVLDPTAGGALTVKGGGGGSKAPATLYAPGCEIQVNSNAGDALCTTGNNATIVSDQILVVGAQNKAKSCNQTQSNVQTGVGGVNDPFGGITDPSTGCNAKNTFGFASLATPITLKSGTGPTLSYDSTTGVMTLTGKDTKGNTVTTTTTSAGVGETSFPTTAPSVNEICFSDPNVTLISPTLGGVKSSVGNEMFVFQNGFTIGGTSSTVTINGTIDLAGGAFTETNANLLIVGPTGLATDQPYTSLAFIDTSTVDGCGSSVSQFGKPPAGCLQLQFGSGTSTTAPNNTCSASLKIPGIVGMVYAPKAVVYMQDSGGCLSATNIIADQFWDNGAVNIYNYNLAYTTSPLDVVRLVE